MITIVVSYTMLGQVKDAPNEIIYEYQYSPTARKPWKMIDYLRDYVIKNGMPNPRERATIRKNILE